MSTIRQRRLLPRDPSSYDGGTDRQFLCKHNRECPLYKAPPCFSRCLEVLLSSRCCYGTSYPDWKQFTRHFDINIPVGERGVVKYWVHDHQNRDHHTIQSILDFAEKQNHSPLLHQFEELIKVHQQTQPDHVCTNDPAGCFKQCSECKLRHVSLPEINIKTNTPRRRCLTVSSPIPIRHLSEDNIPLFNNCIEYNVNSNSVFLDEDTSNNVSPIPSSDSSSVEPPLGPDEVIHFLAPSLFDKEYPYKLFLGNYWILEPIIVLFLAFQTIESIFITLCEDGGAYSVFHDGLNISEFINRIIIFSLRLLVRVVAPFVFYRQLCSMSEEEKALEVKRKKEDYTPPEPKPVPCHQHVTLWSIISHAVIFSVILLYLGAFLIAEERLKDNSICI